MSTDVDRKRRRGPAVEVYLAFGSNIGDRVAAIRSGIDVLHQRGIEPVAFSSLYHSEPKYRTDQPPFINCVGRFSTLLGPQQLLAACAEAEKVSGRRRRKRYGPRELDVDVLLYGAEVIKREGLTVPHPGLVERLFVLVPLAELAPALYVPGMGRVVDMLARARQSLPEEEEVVNLGAFTFKSDSGTGKAACGC